MIIDEASNINLSRQCVVVVGMIEFEAKRFHDRENYIILKLIPHSSN